MKVSELIERLQEIEDPNRIVCIGDPDGPGWANIEDIEINGVAVNLIPESE